MLQAFEPISRQVSAASGLVNMVLGGGLYHKKALYKFGVQHVTRKWVRFVIFYGTHFSHYLSPKYGKGLC
jgi:hypothetical protein